MEIRILGVGVALAIVLGLAIELAAIVVAPPKCFPVPAVEHRHPGGLSWDC